MRFTFLVHPLGPWTLRFMGVRGGAPEIVTTPFGPRGDLHRFAWREDLIHTITRFPHITSDTGASCQGQVVGIPTLPERMLTDQAQTVHMLQQAALQHAQDSDLIGLGALCAIVGLRGEELAARLPQPVTTGNALTCWAAAQTTSLLFDRLSRHPRFHPRVLVVGLPGTVAAAITEVLAIRGLPVEVFHHSYPKTLSRALDEIDARAQRPLRRWTDLNAALRHKGIVVGAGSIGGELALADLRPGTAVIDVAQPLDTTPAQRAREDLLIVEGELVSVPRANGHDWLGFWSSLYNLVVGQDDHHIFACLAEPMVLCLEGRPESFSLGRKLPAERVEAIGQLALKHGFAVRELIHDRHVLSEDRLQRFAAIPWLP
jgi:predicted amino acid dehydrogenase